MHAVYDAGSSCPGTPVRVYPGHCMTRGRRGEALPIPVGGLVMSDERRWPPVDPVVGPVSPDGSGAPSVTLNGTLLGTRFGTSLGTLCGVSLGVWRGCVWAWRSTRIRRWRG